MRIENKLSALWIFVLLNILFRDMHELFRFGFLEEIILGTVNGTVMSEELMLYAAIALEVQILMVILPQLLPYRINRLTNIIVGALAIAAVFAVGGPRDMDDIFFATMQILALAYIIWLAWKWPRQETGFQNKN